MQTYKTAEVAARVGIHPNTVRLYERLELIPRPERAQNGYRVFTQQHIQQLELIRLAFGIEVLQNGLRKKMMSVLRLAAKGDYDSALALARDYQQQLRQEQANAYEAIRLVQGILAGETPKESHLKRKETAAYLGVTIDTLRSWELNGLLSVKRWHNGYRVYTDGDLQRLKIIRTLRLANYSLEAILRLLKQMETDPQTDIQKALDTPEPDADILSVCDKLISSLEAAWTNADRVIAMLMDMKTRFS